MKITAITLAILVSTFAGNATEIKDAYYFLGGQLSIIHHDQKYPVANMSKGYIHYDDGLVARKTKSTIPCVLSFEPSLSSGFVEIEILKNDFFSIDRQKHETQSIQSAFKIGGEIADEIQEIVDERSYDERNFYNHHLADSAQLKVSLLPNVNLSNVYCAIILRHEEHQRKNGSIANAGTFVKAHYLGNVKKDQPTHFNISKTFGPFPIKGAEIDLVLFSKTGNPLPTNRSPQLQRVQIDTTKLNTKIE